MIRENGDVEKVRLFVNVELSVFRCFLADPRISWSETKDSSVSVIRDSSFKIAEVFPSVNNHLHNRIPKTWTSMSLWLCASIVKAWKNLD